MKVDKPWGHEIIWAHTNKYVGKILFIKEGERLSLQHHNLKDETIRILSGIMVLKVGPSLEDALDSSIVMTEGDTYHITPGMVHRMIAVNDTTLLEVSTPELDDVVRHEDDYGRVEKG
jgi:mannose-6-phosphate isomerase-like protein (cupin superfamily)